MHIQVATFNTGNIDENFFSSDDEMASEVQVCVKVHARGVKKKRTYLLGDAFVSEQVVQKVVKVLAGACDSTSHRWVPWERTIRRLSHVVLSMNTREGGQESGE